MNKIRNNHTGQIIDLKTIDQSSELKTRLTVALGQICEVTGWDCGEVWLPNATNTVLELSTSRWINSRINYNCDLALSQFQECSKNFIILPEEGLPGRVWSSQQPEWISNVSVESEGYFLRNQIAKLFGIKAALGLPILANNQVRAVFVLFMLESKTIDQSLVQAIQNAVAELEKIFPFYFQSNILGLTQNNEFLSF
jgi:hypothetical protein